MAKEQDLGGCEGCPLCAWSLAGMEIHKKAGGIATAVGFVPPHWLFCRTRLQVTHQLWVEFPLNQGCSGLLGICLREHSSCSFPTPKGMWEEERGPTLGKPPRAMSPEPSYTRHSDIWRNHPGKTFLSSFWRHWQARPVAVLEQEACKQPWFTCHAFVCPVPVARSQHIFVNSEALL